MAAWILNSSYVGQESCPSIRAIGHIPRDPLHTKHLTTSQSSDPDFFKRYCVRIGALRQFLANRMKAKLERIANSQSRAGTTSADGSCKFECGDSVDCYRVPTDKDLKGWRGPATVVHIEKGKIYCKWQGQVSAYPADQVRFHVVPTFFFDGTESRFWRLMEAMESEPAFYQRAVVLGTRGNSQQGGVVSSSTARHRPVYDMIRQLAVDDMSLPIDGAIVGVGAMKIPAVSARYGVGTLITWRIGDPTSIVFSEKRADWSINLEKMFGSRTDEFASLFIYSYDKNAWGAKEWRVFTYGKRLERI